MAKYFDPKADLTFKNVFGEHKELLMSLLNSLLPLEDGKEIVSIEYLNPELVPETPTKKDSVVDVRCTDTLNRQFIVEMQMYWTNAFKNRALLNTCKAYTRQAEGGTKYNQLRPVYTLSLVDDIAFPDEERFYHRYQPADILNPKNRIDGFEMIFVELPKFMAWQKANGKAQWQDAKDNRITISSMSFKKLAVLWLRFLTEIDERTIVVDDELLADNGVNKALKLVEQAAYTDGQRLTYERYFDMVSRERTALDEREERGEVRGRAEGRAEGRDERTIEIATSMKLMGLSIDQIAQATGLSPEDINLL